MLNLKRRVVTRGFATWAHWLHALLGRDVGHALLGRDVEHGWRARSDRWTIIPEDLYIQVGAR